MAHELPARPAFSTSAEGKIVAVVMIHEEILTDAEASSGKNARVRASEKALRLLEGMSVEHFRKRFNCSCGRAVGGKEATEEGNSKIEQVGDKIEWQRKSETEESDLYIAEAGERKRKAELFPDQDNAVDLESIQRIRIS